MWVPKPFVQVAVFPIYESGAFPAAPAGQELRGSAFSVPVSPRLPWAQSGQWQLAGQ
jgi:hypothetical protein